jgi:hypothetical protein
VIEQQRIGTAHLPGQIRHCTSHGRVGNAAGHDLDPHAMPVADRLGSLLRIA